MINYLTTTIRRLRMIWKEALKKRDSSFPSASSSVPALSLFLSFLPIDLLLYVCDSLSLLRSLTLSVFRRCLFLPLCLSNRLFPSSFPFCTFLFHSLPFSSFLFLSLPFFPFSSFLFLFYVFSALKGGTAMALWQVHLPEERRWLDFRHDDNVIAERAYTGK